MDELTCFVKNAKRVGALTSQGMPAELARPKLEIKPNLRGSYEVGSASTQEDSQDDLLDQALARVDWNTGR